MKYLILARNTEIGNDLLAPAFSETWGLPLSSKPWSDMLHVWYAWHNISETRRVHRHRIRDYPQPANKTPRKGSNMKQYEAIQESENQKVTKPRKIRKTATVPCETASTGAGIPSCAPTPRKTNLAPSPRAMAKDFHTLTYFDLLQHSKTRWKRWKRWKRFSQGDVHLGTM